jgi:hypothetical protein
MTTKRYHFPTPLSMAIAVIGSATTTQIVANLKEAVELFLACADPAEVAR